MTQLEVARGMRITSGADGKVTGPKGPDGVVLYELHSRPEHEKFTESAKVRYPITSVRNLPLKTKLTLFDLY